MPREAGLACIMSFVHRSICYLLCCCVCVILRCVVPPRCALAERKALREHAARLSLTAESSRPELCFSPERRASSFLACIPHFFNVSGFLFRARVPFSGG
jgi:hypothetical protein